MSQHIADEEALRTARRDALAVLLSRAGRGVLNPDEAQLLRQHVETEMRDADTARAAAEEIRRYPWGPTVDLDTVDVIADHIGGPTALTEGDVREILHGRRTPRPRSREQ